MPSITNVGGSITSAVALTLLAWALRYIRGAAQRKGASAGAEQRSQGLKAGRFFSTLSPATLRLLVGCGRSGAKCPSRVQHCDPCHHGH